MNAKVKFFLVYLGNYFFKFTTVSQEFLLGSMFLLGVIVLLYTNLFSLQGHQQFIDLAKSLLQGKLHFLSGTNNHYDASYYHGQYYWPLGPFPAVLLAPFVYIFGAGFVQGDLQFFLNIVNLILLFKIAKKITGNNTTSLWLSFGYVFSTAYLSIGLFTSSWFYAQVVATTLLLLAIYEYFYSKQWIFIGIYLSLAIETRYDLFLCLLFFLSAVLISKDTKNKAYSTIALMFPIAIAISLLCMYNYLRFKAIFEQGYIYQLLQSEVLQKNRASGLWSLAHYPANLFYLFVKGLDPVIVPRTEILKFPFLTYNPWGLSILITSPIFLWIVKAPLHIFNVRLALATTILLLLFILGYYGIGWAQFGYRYALDFYPFLFIVLCYSVKRVTNVLKTLIIASFLFNLYLIMTPVWMQ